MNAYKTKSRLRRGDLVEVRSADEILQTLDADGTLNGLPFMPEMVAFCGKRARVFQRAEHFYTDGVPVAVGKSGAKEFRTNDVVLLEGLRCSGLEHGGCQRGCLLFWREAWLRKEDAQDPRQRRASRLHRLEDSLAQEA